MSNYITIIDDDVELTDLIGNFRFLLHLEPL